MAIPSWHEVTNNALDMRFSSRKLLSRPQATSVPISRFKTTCLTMGTEMSSSEVLKLDRWMQ